MMFKVNKRLDRDMDYYEESVDRRYVDYLKETGNALVIENLIVDVPSVVKKRFVCHTNLCLGDKPLANLRGRSCCTSFDVRVSPKEIERIARVVDRVREKYPTIDEAIEKAGGNWWRYDEEDYNKTLEVKADGGCVFLTPREDGFYKCGLHAASLEMGIDPLRHKPSACGLYPLFMIEIDDDYLLTCTSEETRHIILEDGGEHHHFDCLCPNNMATRPLYQEMRSAIENLFGQKAYKQIHKEARKRGLVEEDGENGE